MAPQLTLIAARHPAAAVDGRVMAAATGAAGRPALPPAVPIQVTGLAVGRVALHALVTELTTGVAHRACGIQVAPLGQQECHGGLSLLHVPVSFRGLCWCRIRGWC